LMLRVPDAFGAIPARVYASGVYIHRQQAKDQRELSRLASKAFPSNQYPRETVTAFRHGR
jgi:hypothetical protein